MTNTMRINFKVLTLIFIVFGGIATSGIAQTGNIYQSQTFRLGEAFYRVAEVTQLADTVLIWGDIQLPGTYLVPRGVNLAQMIAFAKGPSTLRNSETDLDWSKVFVEVTVTNRDTRSSRQYRIQVDGTVPTEVFDHRMRNYDTVIIRVRRKPIVLDYVRAYTPIVSGVLSTFLLYRTIKDL